MLQTRRRTQPRPAPGVRGAPHRGVSPGSIVPYDYAASFALTGRPGNVVQDVINISTEGVFVAVAIGYGFEEDRARPLSLNPVQEPAPSVVPGDITLGEISPPALIEGFRINPRLEPMVFRTGQPGARGARNEKEFSNQPLAATLVRDVRAADLLLQRLKPPEEISFLLNILDSGSGRELQDEPIHNLASLGKSNGERPFRPLAQPITFLPRSTVRLQVIERSEGVRGTLFIVFFGYKALSGGCPEPLVRTLHGPPACPTETVGSPSGRVIPFDYVATLELAGRPGNFVETEVPISVEGGFVSTALGYGLQVTERAVAIQWDRESEIQATDLKADDIKASAREALRRDLSTALPIPTFNLGNLPLRLFPPEALTDGIRIHANFLRIAFEANGLLADSIPVTLADQIFERLNRPDDASFRYKITDTGRGIDLQNQPIHNIAGLGIANGDRPFKKFARPIIFFPRSTIRIGVEERFGRGTLFLVFQGYKFFSAAPAGGRP